MHRTTALPALLLSLCLGAAASASAAAQTADHAAAADSAAAQPALDAGRELTRLFLAGDTAAVRARFDEHMQAAMDPAALAAFREQVAAQLGEEQSLVSEDVVRVQGLASYVRVSKWSGLPAPVLTQWVFAPDGRVAGFVVRPADATPRAADSPYLQRDTVADLRLPFEGQWYVFWGGHDIAQNYHAANPQQRFAYDFVQRVDGSSHRGDGRELAQYYCWGEPILAPAGGRVVEAVDGLPDQPIGTTNTVQPFGNHVVLDLGTDEYAVFAHLRRGSVAVEPGAQVAAGTVLGRCGNSGNTSEPHLHFHLQDSPVLGEGLGLPAFFNGYVADGAPVGHGEPVRGQVLRAD